MNSKSSKSSLFLIELIVVILFFSISSAIIVQIFAKAHEIDLKSRALTFSSREIQNVAECYRSVQGDYDQTIFLLNDQTVFLLENGFEIYYTSDFQACDLPDPNGYLLHADFSQISDFRILTLSMIACSSNETLYEITIEKYDHLVH